MWKLIGILAVPLFVFLSWGWSKSSDDRDVRGYGLELISHVDGYDQDPGYYDSLFNSCHDAAFEASYDQNYGGRRRGVEASFDWDIYYNRLLQLMRQEVRSRQQDSSHAHCIEALSLAQNDWNEHGPPFWITYE